MESRNALETYLYNLKTSYEDSLKDKIADDDLEELKTSVEAALEVCCARQLVFCFVAKYIMDLPAAYCNILDNSGSLIITRV